MKFLGSVIKWAALDNNLLSVKSAAPAKYYKMNAKITSVQPQDRLTTLLMDLAASQLDAWNTIEQFMKKNRADAKVLERMRIV
jgi:hypothetical protein